MPRPKLSIHEDIARASTLPARFYSDPEIFEELRERVFARSWQFIAGGDADSIKAPGQTHPFTLLEGCLDEPMVLTRDFDDRVHCLSNVCTHRGTIVCEGPGLERHLRCRYHGRRFGLDGCFQHMPEFEQAKDFPSEKDNLRQFPLERWGNFLFTSLNPSVSIENWLEPMRTRLSWLPLEEFVFDSARSRDYLVQANWALYCDNYLEGFHIPYVHASLSEVLDYGSYHTELYAWSNLQLGIAKDSEDAFDLPKSSPDYGKRIAAYYFWLFPNLMFNVYSWGISVNVVRPLAVDRTRVSFLKYVWDREKLAAGGGAGSGLDRVEREDEAIVEAVQRGVRSRFYESGRYSPTREQGVHHFHRLLAKTLG
jgi:choline monooxygenase